MTPFFQLGVIWLVILKGLHFVKPFHFLYYSLMEELKITLVQSDLVWEDPSKNLENFDKCLNLSDNLGHLVILPEMFATGFSMQPQKFAINSKPQHQGLTWMLKTAEEKKLAICGSLISEEDGKYFNRLYFVLPNGEYHTYNKRHLFSLAGEEKIYSPGDTKLVIDYLGWRINPLICYDLRFPVWCRNDAEIDLQIFVANWPERRSEAWKSLLKARAIENMCFVAGLNRIGDDGNGIYHSGDSCLFNELGDLVSDIPSGKASIKTYTLGKNALMKSRNRFGFLNDRDGFKLL
tara:strand:+ start:307 stop:1182 length:876 start_codon:yes stop_codon:yes gene_type:complete